MFNSNRLGGRPTHRHPTAPIRCKDGLKHDAHVCVRVDESLDKWRPNVEEVDPAIADVAEVEVEALEEEASCLEIHAGTTGYPGSLIGSPEGGRRASTKVQRAGLQVGHEEESPDRVAHIERRLPQGEFVEVQGSGEEATFSQQQLDEMLSLGRKGISQLIAAQRAVLDELDAAAR